MKNTKEDETMSTHAVKVPADMSTFFSARDQEHRAAKVAIAKCIVDEYLKEGDSILWTQGPLFIQLRKSLHSGPWLSQNALISR